MANNYFENLVNSIDDGNMFKNDIPCIARNILEKAYEEQMHSINWFECSREEENDIYWKMSCEASERANGLLRAYFELTNREVINIRYAIEAEINWIDETFLVNVC